MHVPILIEPREGGGFRATAGVPFALSAEAMSEADAASALETMLRSKLKQSRVAFLQIENEAIPPLRFDAVPDEDWFFETMRDAIEENRRTENEAQG